MGKIIFIAGGARSGKSTYAQGLAMKSKSVAFIATCLPLDKEMVNRIKAHKKNRPGHWQTFEEPKDVAAVIKRIGKQFDCILIDCLTLLISNLFLDGYGQKAIEGKIKEIISSIKSFRGKAIIVSNEVGLGIVPDNLLGRDFRDIAGKVNQIVAKEADKAYFMVVGIPLKIK